eukprot:GHVO01015114.1.p1 GENE.GHVO01015114.1~~GHVO01015114.1.p1  ORF type:complete len:231 (+),score=35.30 GHVO01015114.1:31-693(+)
MTTDLTHKLDADMAVKLMEMKNDASMLPVDLASESAADDIKKSLNDLYRTLNSGRSIRRHGNNSLQPDDPRQIASEFSPQSSIRSSSGNRPVTASRRHVSRDRGSSSSYDQAESRQVESRQAASRQAASGQVASGQVASGRLPKSGRVASSRKIASEQVQYAPSVRVPSDRVASGGAGVASVPSGRVASDAARASHDAPTNTNTDGSLSWDDSEDDDDEE